MVERLFSLKENNTTVLQEARAGLTTFFTMSYIIFVQPALMKIAGMDPGAVMVATCVSSAIATFLMGILANYPIGLAPGMGHNFFFVFTAVLTLKFTWQMGLGAVFLSGSAFIILSFFGFREAIINAVPPSLRHGIAIGIGFLITLVGLSWGGIVVAKKGTIVGLGDFKSTIVLITFFGLFVISVLLTFRVKSAILFGIILTALLSVVLGYARFHGIFRMPPSIEKTFLKLDIAGLFHGKNISDVLTIIFVFFFLDLFDTVGTLIGVSEQAGFMKNGRLPRARQALLSDAVGTVVGALLGTSTVTSYIESSAGVASGAKTGLASVFTALFFILALFFYPLVETIGEGVKVSGTTFYPAIAPALIIIGVFMIKGAKNIEWDEPSEAIPAFLTIVMMAFSLNITEGISVGFISYTVLNTFKSGFKKVHPILYIFSVLFILRYIFLV